MITDGQPAFRPEEFRAARGCLTQHIHTHIQSVMACRHMEFKHQETADVRAPPLATTLQGHRFSRHAS